MCLFADILRLNLPWNASRDYGTLHVNKLLSLPLMFFFTAAEQWCLALRDAEPTNIGSGVSIIEFQERNGKEIARANKDWKHNILFCRERTNDLFEAVMRELKTGNGRGIDRIGGKVIVTGAPGIGKSAMLYRIMRLAFREKRKVVFDRRQDKEALVFLPRDDNTYECWKYNTFGGVSGVLDVLRDPEAFLLVDPGEAGGGPPISVAAATLIAASSNPKHFQQFGKNPFCAKMYMTNWTLGELLAVREYIDSPKLTEEDVRQRFSDVGGIVRHVYSKFYDSALKEQETKLKELPLEMFVNPEMAHACSTRKGVSHCIFTYYDVDDP
jgi:hypothetical protein